MSYPKNAASPPALFATVVKASDGTAITTGVAAKYSTGAGAQGAGGGTCQHEGNGQWSYTPTQAETNVAAFGVQFYHASAVGSGPTVSVVTDNLHVDAYGGAIWLDGNASNENTIVGVDGVPTNPVSTMAAALTLAAALNIKVLRIRSTIAVQTGDNCAGYLITSWTGGDDWSATLNIEAPDATALQLAAIVGIGLVGSAEAGYMYISRCLLNSCGPVTSQIVDSTVVGGLYIYPGAIYSNLMSSGPQALFVGSTGTCNSSLSGRWDLYDVATDCEIYLTLLGGMVGIYGTGGTVHLYGSGSYVDGSGGAVTIDATGLSVSLAPIQSAITWGQQKIAADVAGEGALDIQNANASGYGTYQGGGAAGEKNESHTGIGQYNLGFQDGQMNAGSGTYADGQHNAGGAGGNGQYNAGGVYGWQADGGTAATNPLPAVAGDAMALTSGERTTLAGVIWSYATRTLTSLGTVVADVAAAVWAYAARALTQSAAQVAEAVDGSDLTIKRGDTFTAPLTGLGNISARAKLWLTIKSSRDDDDAEAVIQVRETTGLLYLNGAAAVTTTDGSLVVTDEALGNVTITLKPALTAALELAGNLHYDIQMLTTAGAIQTITEANAKVAGDVTRAVS